jgi:nitrite reductase (NADH) small subunit
MSESTSVRWKAICSIDDILPDTGVGALIGQQQVAVFRTSDNVLYALDNHDPFSGANVLARGILGSVGDKRVVSSPIYKQHFCLDDGACIEDESVSLKVWPVRQREGVIEVGFLA